MLIQRFLTALVLVPLSVAAVLLTSSVQFCFFISAVVLVAAWEWAVLLNAPLWGRLLYALGLGAAMFVMYLHPLLWRPLCFAAVLFWLLALYWVLQYPKSKSVWYRPVVVWVLGLCVLLPSWVSLMVVRHDMT
ncbi:MAG: phosphatidate cytidylyltransferase, partial [Gammaproteobacteria bacterium]